MIVLILIVAFVVLAVVLGVKQAKEDKADGVVASFRRLRMTSTELIEGRGANAVRHPLAGLSAQVEDSGTLNRRITATRLLTIGVFALAARKKQDDREVFLTIEGPNTAILETVSLKQAKDAAVKARQFANQINLRSRQLEAEAA